MGTPDEEVRSCFLLIKISNNKWTLLVNVFSTPSEQAEKLNSILISCLSSQVPA